MPVSIRSRLLLLVLSVLLPGTAAALWLIGETQDGERRAVERNLRDTTRALSLVVDRELAQRAAIARVLALSRLLDDAPLLTPQQLDGFAEQARRAVQGLGGWVELHAPGGRLLITPRADAGTTTATATATVTAEAAGGGAASALTTARSTVAPPAMPPSGPATLVDLALVGPLERPPGGGPLRAGIVQPVRRDRHTLLNVTVTILPDELQGIVDQQRLPAGWVGAVVDGHGSVVARHPGGAAYAGRAVTAELKARMALAREGLFDAVSLDGVPVSAYFSTSAQGWSYVTAVPRRDLDRGLSRAVLQVGFGAALLLALAVGGALWVARRIVAPVVSLKQAAARLQAGLPVQHRPTGIAECDEVGGALAEAGDTLRHARADLERQVGDAVARTREAEQRVARNQRVEALGRLTGGVAHDFNNLLGVISNSAHLIERQAAADPVLRAAVAATLRAVDGGSRLTRQLLRFSGHQPVRPTAVDLGRFLPELHELLKTLLGRRIEASVAVAAATRRITVDTSELELALINLALNARDALPAGGGHVWLKAGNAQPHDTGGLPPGRYVLISVGDDGKGLAEELAERAFEPFFTTKPVGQGSGLGLSQVHGFCTQAGGVARLASTPGLGTTVSMVLPATDDDDDSGSAAAAAAHDAGAGVAGKRVLLVEDNAELGDVTSALLESYGCTVQRARSADEALTRLIGSARPVGTAPSEERFDVVLSDVVMPGGMDGVALARVLRECLPALPVVLISGYSSALADTRDFVALRKPCAPDDLVAALQRAMAAPVAPPKSR